MTDDTKTRQSLGENRGTLGNWFTSYLSTCGTCGQEFNTYAWGHYSTCRKCKKGKR